AIGEAARAELHDLAAERLPERAVFGAQRRQRIAAARHDHETASGDVIERPLALATDFGLRERVAGARRAARNKALGEARHAEGDELFFELLVGFRRLHRAQLIVADLALLRIALVDMEADAHALDDGGARARPALGLIAVEEAIVCLALQHEAEL